MSEDKGTEAGAPVPAGSVTALLRRMRVAKAHAEQKKAAVRRGHGSGDVIQGRLTDTGRASGTAQVGHGGGGRDREKEDEQENLPPRAFSQFFADRKEEALFEELHRKWRAKADVHPSYATIPRFFFGPRTEASSSSGPASNSTRSSTAATSASVAARGTSDGPKNQDGRDTTEPATSLSAPALSSEAARALLRETAHSYQLLTRHNSSITNDELQFVWGIIQEEAGDKDTLTYAQFKSCAQRVAEATPKFAEFFSPSTFLILCKDRYNCVSINHFFDLIMYVVNWKQRYLALCQYADDSGEYISEDALSDFIADQLADMPALANLADSFVETYLVYATRKFVFLHDLKNKKMRIKDLLVSESMEEFFELRQDPHAISPARLKDNWFSIPAVRDIHAEYIRLDADQDGMLSVQEMRRFRKGSINPMIIERVFDECKTYAGKLDFRAYLDFVLAHWCIQTPQATRYFFKLLDMEHQQCITPANLYHFFQGMHRHPLLCGFEYASFEDIRTEIIDIVKPGNVFGITLPELLACGKADHVILMLVDANYIFHNENLEDPQDVEMEEEGDEQALVQQPIPSTDAEP